MRCARVLAWRPDAGRADRRYRADCFTEAAHRIVAALVPLPQEPVVVTLEGGVKRGLDGERAALVEGWRQTYRAELDEYHAKCRRTGVKGYKELSLFTFVGFVGGLRQVTETCVAKAQGTPVG